MIQLNLLPSVKAEYVKAQRTRRTVIVVSVIVIAASLGVTAILAGVAYGTQKLELSNAQTKIKESSDKLQSVNDLANVLTIQNQLNTLDSLHEAKPVMTRLFGYIQQTTPQAITIDSLSVNNSEKTISVEGAAPTLNEVNKYVDTLKFTTIGQTPPNADPNYAFSEVVLSQFSKQEGLFSFMITLKFDESLFSSADSTIAIYVPKEITTRSVTETPKIFAPNPDTEGEE